MNILMKGNKMKKTCTVFFTVLVLTSCAKKMINSSSDSEAARNPATINGHETHQTLKSSSNNQSVLTFDVAHEYIIPHFIETTKGSSEGQVAKIYFDYSSQDSEYAYFCRYFPSKDNSEFIFDNCFKNEMKEIEYDLNPDSNSSMTHRSGRPDDVYEDNSIIFEVINTQNLDSINARVQIETRPLY